LVNLKSPSQLSHELRNEVTPDLTRRRWIVGLSLLGTLAGQAVTLYQMGIVKKLPDPPLPYIDSSRVDASEYAYKRLQSPDAPAMIVSYGITAALAAAGGKDRARDLPLVPIALLAKTIYDSFVALELAREEWQYNKAFCAYCQLATIASLVSVGIALPEAIRAIQQLSDTRAPLGEQVGDYVGELVGR
jgi:uncharacterized membrane protein